MFDLDIACVFSAPLVLSKVSFSRAFLSTSIVVEIASGDEHWTSVFLLELAYTQAPAPSRMRTAAIADHFRQDENQLTTKLA
jgi:hypothetical protein